MPEATADQERRDFAPGTNVINILRKQNFSWHVALKELIDNAIDASATNIWIDIHPGQRRVRVVDDGEGCADLWAMITLGGRADHPGTQIGQNGIGLKDAAIWLARVLKIRSVREGVARELDVNWDSVIEKGEWKTDRTIGVTQVEEPNGTTITLTRILKGRPDRDKLLKTLAQTYRPAMEQGRTLWMKFGRETDFLPILPFVYPALLHQQTESLHVNGKRAQVTMGIVPPGETFDGRGLLYIYGPRVIVADRRSGIAHEALSELFGWVEFAKDDWALEKNKREFLDDLTPLEDTIAERFADLIARASHHHVAQPLEDISKILNERLKAFRLTQGPRRKALRDGPHTKEGTQAATGEGSPHRRARKTQPGNTFSQERFPSMHFARLGVGGDICQLKGDDVLLVNEESPIILDALGNRRQLEQILAFALATHLGTKNEGEQGQLVFPLKEFEPPGIADRIFKIFKILLGIDQGQSEAMLIAG